MIKFSVIVPVYNVSTYLCRCMESIIEQTYRNLEIICIDDGSTDDSGSILDMYERLDKRIRVVHNRNAGYGYTINLGISMAIGDYISIVESDDYIVSDMYERFNKIITEHHEQIDFIKASFYKVSEHECIMQELFHSNTCGKVINPQEDISLFWIPCSIWSAVYKKDFLVCNKINFLETPGASYQDTSFWFKVLSVAKTIILSNEAVYFYRVDNENSSINSDTKAFCVCGEIREIERYVTEHVVATPFLEGVRYAYIYRTYMWNYYRLPIGLRSAFWTEMVREFMKMKHSCEFKCDYWKQDEWKLINEIIADPEGFLWRSDPIIRKLYLDQYTARDVVYEEFIRAYIDRQDKIVIYGAGVYGRQVYKYIKRHDLVDHLIGFAVTDQNVLSGEIEGKKIYKIEDLIKDKEELAIIVAVKEASQLAILKHLRILQFRNVLRVDDVFWKIINTQ